MAKSKIQTEHFNKARHNGEFLNQVNKAFPDDYSDWKITVCFYTALHVMAGYSAFKGQKLPENHHNTLLFLDPKAGTLKLPVAVFDKYRFLLYRSRKARYDAFSNKKGHEALHAGFYLNTVTYLNDITAFAEKETGETI